MSRVRRSLLLVGLLAFASSAASAQGCSMCKTGAETASAEQQRSLNHGILMLALPSVVIFAGISVLAFRYRPSASLRSKRAPEPQD